MILKKRLEYNKRLENNKMIEKEYADICKISLNLFFINRDVFFKLCNVINDEHTCNIEYLRIINKLSKCSQNKYN